MDVVAPGGRLRKAQTAPTVSARVISAPPCITNPAVQRSGDQARRPVTSSGAARSTSIPVATANGIMASRAAGSTSGTERV